jgi:hypothetical protein
LVARQVAVLMLDRSQIVEKQRWPQGLLRRFMIGYESQQTRERCPRSARHGTLAV